MIMRKDFAEEELFKPGRMVMEKEEEERKRKRSGSSFPGREAGMARAAPRHGRGMGKAQSKPSWYIWVTVSSSVWLKLGPRKE